MKMYLKNSILILTGIVLAFAYDNLSRKRNASQSSTHEGADNLYKADNAVDGDPATCMRTVMIGETSPEKTVWWKVDLGGVYSIYSVNILIRNYVGLDDRQRGRFAGFSLYVSTTGVMDNSSLCYKDGPELPPLNFTTTCMTSGRYVTYYNERLQGVTYPDGYQLTNVYTELCEVSVLGCRNSGVYGSNCDIPCPTNCRHNTCHIQKGICFGCQPGWKGTKCGTQCAVGWYGLECKQQCSGHCRDNTVCNHVTGQCDGGCAAGWQDFLCNKECKNGTYGNNCIHNCSGNCLNDSPCNKQTGHCNGGCKPGYTNALCNEHCTPGYFGNKCETTCSWHCLNNKMCDRIDGTCTDGCQDGYIGKQCNKTCKEGFYGPNCTCVCSSNCKTCEPTDGTCSCSSGWRGSNCSIGCEKSYGEDCRYPCSTNCFNQTCDRFNGFCLLGCDNGYHGRKCDQEYAPTNCLESGIIGATISACVFTTTAIIIFVVRRKRLSTPSTNSSPYAEIGNNHQSGDSTYQELTVTELDKAYQNLALR